MDDFKQNAEYVHARCKKMITCWRPLTEHHTWDKIHSFDNMFSVRKRVGQDAEEVFARMKARGGYVMANFNYQIEVPCDDYYDRLKYGLTKTVDIKMRCLEESVEAAYQTVASYLRDRLEKVVVIKRD